ncbi:O-antigen polymerase [Providencia huaxiensis]|uniref:O-antigen polymerase n=1 Tax=Providencia huaxiensis TaxID=2027290 RepID=UPI0034E5A87F
MKIIFSFILFLFSFLLTSLIDINIEFFCIIFTFTILLLTLNGLFDDFKQPFAIFNVFYVVFLAIGLLMNTAIRLYTPISAKMVLIGYFFVNFFYFLYLLTEKNKNHSSIYKDKDKDIKRKKTLSLLAFIFILMGYLGSIFYYLKIGTIPLFSAQSAKERIEFVSGSGVYLQLIRIGIITSIIAIFSLTRYKLFYRLSFIFLLLSILGTSFRGEFLQFIILFLLILFYKKNISLNYKKILVFGLLIIISSFMISLIRNDITSNETIVFKIFNMFGVSIYNLNLVLDNIKTFYYGETYFFSSLSIIGLGKEYTQWLTSLLPIKFDGGVTPTIIGDSYLNFGELYFIPILFIGMLLFFCEKMLNKNNNNIIYIVFYCNLALYLARSTTGGISNITLQLVLSSIVIYTLIISSKIK